MRTFFFSPRSYKNKTHATSSSSNFSIHHSPFHSNQIDARAITLPDSCLQRLSALSTSRGRQSTQVFSYLLTARRSAAISKSTLVAHVTVLLTLQAHTFLTIRSRHPDTPLSLSVRLLPAHHRSTQCPRFVSHNQPQFRSATLSVSQKKRANHAIAIAIA